MKKFFAVLLTVALLVSMFAVAVSAAWDDESKWTQNEKGEYAFPDAYGFVFDIDDVDGVIDGEDSTLITNESAYAACNPNWAITVALAATDNANEYSVVKVAVTPGSAAAADLDWNAIDLALVVHSAASDPNTQHNGAPCDNWQSKVAAVALKAGDVITVSEDQKTATVLDPNAGEGGEEDTSEPEVIVPAIDLDELLGEANADAKFDVEITVEGDYEVDAELTVVATVKNITAEPGIHILKFDIMYDAEKLLITNDLIEEDNNAVDCITKVPTEDYENFNRVEYDFDEDTEISTPKNDGLINASVVYMGYDAESAAKADGDIVLTFTFKVLDNAGQAAIYAPNAKVEGSYNTEDDFVKFVGNGSGVVLGEAPKAPETDDEEVPEAMPFWVTHFNDLAVEGAGVIVTQTGLAGGSWNNYYAFAPVKDLPGVYEIVDISIGIGTGTASQPAIPNGGFVYSINVGNNWPEINADGSGINYTSDNCNAMCDLVTAWAKGDQFVIEGVDFSGKIPTSTADKNWYDPAYKCTATITKYVGQDLGGVDVDTSNKPSTPNTGDASSMIVFAILAVVAIAGSAVVIKTRK